ncbi:MAG: peptide deformylase [Pseudomonadales bacterium]|nr:peptide deformylase [Pseudomonadales bacterium]
MTQLSILEYPDPALRQSAAPVENVDSSIEKLVDDMLETMYSANGVGLAAVQVGVPLQVIVADVSETKKQPIALINPEISDMTGEQELIEGCLSVPGAFARVKRAKQIEVKCLDKHGDAVTHEADDLLSVCFQHEIDHLTGVMFLDHLSRLKRTRIARSFTKKRAAA